MAAIFKGSYLSYINNANKKYNQPRKFIMAVHDAKVTAQEREANAIAKAGQERAAREASFFGRYLG